MGPITATNQQYYTSYPAVVPTGVGMSATAMGHEAYAPTNQTYQQMHQQHHQQHLQSYQHEPHHHHHHPQQQQHHLQQHHQQQQQHHLQHHHHHHQQQQQQQPNHLSTVSNHQTSLRTVSAHSTNSSANAMYGIEAAKSTKGASKQRRDQINAEIAQLRELLPLPVSTRQRLSQLQLMALVLVYVRKSNYFCNVYANFGITRELGPSMSGGGFSKALNGFLMMLTQKGKLLYISDNAAEYLGHSMEDLLSHGDEVYDIIEDQDKKTVRTELLMNEEEQSTPAAGATTGHHLGSSKPSGAPLQLPTITGGKPSSTGQQHQQTNIALCRMNVSRHARRQMRFGDQKVVLIEGHYFGSLPLTSRDEPVFLATCTPIAMPETRECVVQGSTNVFTSIHSMDMKFLYIDSIGEHHLGYTKKQLYGSSWYELVHHDHLQDAQAKHKRLASSEQERSTILLLRLMSNNSSPLEAAAGTQSPPIWIHSVMQVKEATESGGQPVIVCTNQVLSEREAQVMRKNSWLYQFHSLHSKVHCTSGAGYSSGSPLIGGAGSRPRSEDAQTPNSVCSDYGAGADGALSEAAKAALNTITKAQGSGELLGAAVSKSPRPASSKLISGKHSPTGGLDSAFASSDTSYQQQQQQQQTTTAYPQTGSNSSGYQQAASILQGAATAGIHKPAGAPLMTGGKLLASSSPSSLASTVSTSPHSSSSSSTAAAAAYAAAAAAAASAKQPYLMHHMQSPTSGQQQAPPQQQQRSFHHHQSADSLGGSSSASSTSSLLSQNSDTTTSTTPNGSTSQVAATAASLYAAGCIDAGSIDPLHHMHQHQHQQAATSHQQHHPAASSAVYGAGPIAVAPGPLHHQHHHPHHAAAAVNYANQVMVAHQQRHHPHHPHHHHHHSYHPYHHHQHHPVSMHHHAGHHQTAHVAPHHHSHHTAPQAAAAAALYAGSPHPVAFNAHHHAAAAYHSAAAVAAQVASSHPVAAAAAAAHHSQASSLHHQNPYQAAAAAAAVHQGVSFHYNKIAAAVNASA